MADEHDRAVAWAKCAADAAYACHHYGVIDDAQGHGAGGGVMPFHLWPAQAGVMWALMTRRLIIILKARQLGISWICCWYALWLCLWQDGKVVLLFSKGQAEANELLRRIKDLYDRLPDWMRAAGPALAKDNTEELVWANGSRVRSLPASQGAGRGHTASLVILDEAAFLQFADQLYTALKPTIDAGGQLVIISTANGIGNLFHQLWTKAVAGLSDFTTIFLPWWSRPGRTASWYAAQLAEYTDPQMVKQEYPGTATEAFLVSGRTRFAAEWVAHQGANARPGLPRGQWPEPLRPIQGLAVYAPPTPGRRYVLAGDVAEGLESGDYSAATLIDAETWEELAALHGHWEPDEYAGLLHQVAEVYNAEIAVERNNHGHAVLATLRRLCPRRIAEGHDERQGWLTNAQTKPQMIDLLATALRDAALTGAGAVVRTQAALDELQIYRIGKSGDTGAPSGYHDDRVMSWAIALMVARRPRQAAQSTTLAGLWQRR